MTTRKKTSFKNLEKAVRERDRRLLEASFDSSADPVKILAALARGLDAAREKLGDCTSPVAEFLMSVDVMRAGLDRIKASGAFEGKGPTVVIGVMLGDVHDLGKNIVAGVLEACGCTVVDLGRDVPPQRFIEAVERNNASVLALSTMMSTPLADMAKTVELCKARFPHVKIIVGGAPLDEKVAENMGADGYAESVVGAPGEVERIMNEPPSAPPSGRVFMDYEKKLRVEEV